MSEPDEESEKKMAIDGAENRVDPADLAVLHLTQCTNCDGGSSSKCISVPTCNCKGGEAKRCKTNVLSPNSACNPVSSKSDFPHQSDTPGLTFWKDSNCVVDESADGQCLGCSARKLSDPSPHSDSGLENSPDLSFHSSGVKTVKDMKCHGSFKNGNSSNAEGGFPSESGRERTSLNESYLDDDPLTVKSVENNLPSGRMCPETNSETQQSCLPDSGRGRAQTQKLNFGDDVSVVKSSDGCQPSVPGEAGLTKERQYMHVDPDTQSSHASVIPNGDFSSLLPQEVFLTILSYFTPRELARYVAPVCKRWREVSKDPILWQTLELDTVTVSSVFMCRLVRHCPLLRTLLIRGRRNFEVLEAMLLTHFCQNLEELDLSFTQNIDVHRLKPFVEKCPKLRSLNIEGCCQVDGAAVRVLVNATRLQRLNLSHCVKLVDKDVRRLVDCLPKITQLNVDGIKWVTDVSVTRLVSLHGPHLTHLLLDGEELTDISLHAIGQCSNLRQLSISFCGALTEDCLVSLKCLVHLRRLCLRNGEGFTSEALCDAFSGTELSQLTYLNISNCTNIGDEAILSVVQCCGKTLKEFLLDWCLYITDVGLTSIIDHCGSLCVLSLVGVNLMGDALDRIPEDIPTLTRLDLYGVVQIDDALPLDLVRRKADLKIVNYSGLEITGRQFATCE